jgi:hypothetical protein
MSPTWAVLKSLDVRSGPKLVNVPGWRSKIVRRLAMVPPGFGTWSVNTSMPPPPLHDTVGEIKKMVEKPPKV